MAPHKTLITFASIEHMEDALILLGEHLMRFKNGLKINSAKLEEFGWNAHVSLFIHGIVKILLKLVIFGENLLVLMLRQGKEWILIQQKF